MPSDPATTRHDPKSSQQIAVVERARDVLVPANTANANIALQVGRQVRDIAQTHSPGAAGSAGWHFAADKPAKWQPNGDLKHHNPRMLDNHPFCQGNDTDMVLDAPFVQLKAHVST